ncbi:hypothetical protein MESS4_p40028 [Mesorhizobium sp. STM 4661]|nr:hypothetical protein MESS4_p40028 [Mesorhizobium sp. STM 4661]
MDNRVGHVRDEPVIKAPGERGTRQMLHHPIIPDIGQPAALQSSRDHQLLVVEGDRPANLDVDLLATFSNCQLYIAPLQKRYLMRMTKALKVGLVWSNTYRSYSYMMPVGGTKRSGVGRDALESRTR